MNRYFWLRGMRCWWSSRRTAAPARRDLRPGLRPLLEPLEDRTLPSVTYSLYGGTLDVHTDASGDVATVRANPGNSSQTQVLDGSNVIAVINNTWYSSLDISLHGGNDALVLGDDNLDFLSGKTVT